MSEIPTYSTFPARTTSSRARRTYTTEPGSESETALQLLGAMAEPGQASHTHDQHLVTGA
ncbi:MAG: hypothetical protein ACRD29_21320 [Acidimicrobiales bacterium]